MRISDWSSDVCSSDLERIMGDELKAALDHIFSADSSLYRDRGFMRRIGYGKKPALINIDLANAWTRPGNAFTCDGMDVIIPGVQKLLDASRAKGIPVVYTTTAYDVTEGPNSDMGLWHLKIPVEVLKTGSEACAIDDRIAPLPGEQVIVKKRASAFHGTYLSGFLRAARSEEHTSELQSLMRISYAVFCLKKKKNTKKHTSVKNYKYRQQQKQAQH